MADPVFEYYQHLAIQYDKARFTSAYARYVHRQEFQFLSRHLENIPPAQTLDLACGTGRLLAFADTGLDFSPNMLAVARKKWPGKELLCADAQALPFPGESFRAVIALNFFMHLPEAQARQVLREIYRVLRPGGLLLCNFPSAKRRQLTGHKTSSWYAASAYSLASWQALTTPHWQLLDWRGTLFFPIHRLPLRLRWPLRRTDDWLCLTVFKEYASFILVAMQKNAS